MDHESEKKATMRDDSKKGFPVFAIIFAIVSLLAIVWILTNFLVVICTIVIVVMLKIANTTKPSGATSNGRTNTHSLPQFGVECSRGVADETTAEPSLTVYQRIPINRRELKNTENIDASEQDSGGEFNDECPSAIEQGITDGSVLEHNAPTIDLADVIAHLPDETGIKIDHLIAHSDTVAVSIVSSDDLLTSSDSDTNNSLPIPVPTVVADATASVTLPQTTAAPVARRSPLVTENVMKIAVSYSGKKRKRVLKITRFLQSQIGTNDCPHPVFIDQDFQHEISRLNGLAHLQSIYRQAQLVVVFLSPSYPDSKYCNGEWRTIAQRFLTDRKNRHDTQLLLVKLGEYDMEQLGLVDNDFYLNGLRRSNEEIAKLIALRWELVEKSLEQKKNDTNIP